jgi:DNA replicative helicase MCM subunit Mcm2 (Cdc46/Mcm family)
MADDYSLDSRLSELITTGSISNKLLSREDAIFLTQEHTKLNDGKVSQKLLDSRLSARKVIRPATYEDFKQEMEELGWNYSAMGRKYGVSDKAIRKWERFYLKYDL